MERQKEADLSGRVAIVTGSSRGIGKRAALALARRGARLVVTARAVETSGSELPGTIGQTVKEIESLGAEAIAVAADLSKEDDLEQIVHSAVDRFGGVDILVNNAAVTVGYNWSAPLLEMPRPGPGLLRGVREPARIHRPGLLRRARTGGARTGH
jgi:NAD(P)-dependent dehydrogenase (short-subunit alcohol dehydrogenase family)